MKSLKKIKIINWHYFWNETICIEPIVFLTGLNASGKSTLIDAMQVLLLGDTSGRFFNKAATEKSSRTLKGYLRGELGDAEEGGFRYLRNGRFTSYIAMEFYDDLHESSFTFGIVFDSFNDGSEEHRFFLLEDKIPENEFVMNNIPMEYKALNEYFSKNYPGKFKFFDSNRHYQDNLKRKFGGLKDKYFSLFKKAVSFSPITDIETFITEYVCDAQTNINIDSMQANILQYKKLQTEAMVMAGRIERLTEIEKAYKAYVEQKDSLTLYSYIIERAEYQNDLNRLASYHEQGEKAQKRLLEIDDEIHDIEEEIQNFQRKKEKLTSDKLTSDTYRMTDELREEKRKTEERLAALQRETKEVETNLLRYAESFIKKANDLVETLHAFDFSLLDEDKKTDLEDLENNALDVIRLSSQMKDEHLAHIETLTVSTLNEWRDALNAFKNQVSALNVTLGKTIHTLDQKVALLRQQEVDMMNGGKSYERGLSYLRQELAAELRRRHSRDIEVAIFADLIDIKTPLWTNAIEGFLSSQKFNLFVEPQYYLEAHEILRELSKKVGFYGTNLVDQAKIIERHFTCEKGALAEEIITDHEGARGYTNFLIGRLKKCKTVQEARESGNGITAQCDLYRNFALSSLNPRSYTPSYIGRKVGAEQIEQKHKEVAKYRELVELYRNLYRIVGEANSLEMINAYEIQASLSLIDKTGDIEGLKENLDFIEKELEKHDLSQIKTIDQRIKDIEEDIRGLERDRSSLFEEKGTLQAQIRSLNEEKIPEEMKKAEERKARLDENYDGFFVDETAQPAFEQLLNEKMSTIEIVSTYKVKLTKAQYLQQNFFSELVKLRKDYIRDYRLSYDAETKDNDVYDQELTDMRDVKLPQYQVAITDAYEKATKQFKDDFISKLKTAIETVEAQIEDLNAALSASTFGNDSYRFVVRPSQEYRRYYDMIKDELLLEVGEDDSAFVTKYQDVMNDLFRQIVDVGEKGDRQSAVLANVEKFTDYRSYLEFDLIVRNRDGVEQRLSKTLRKKSGGETQTPFYIAVLASFAQLYRVNEKGELGNSFRLIIFDEAFSKMDRGRIKESIRLLRKFGLQAILSAPSDKVSDISELVDETLVVLHDKNTSRVRLYAEEDKITSK